MTTPAEVRKQVILDKLRDEPLTTEELATRLELNYHTAYKSCRELQEAGLVHYTGQVRGKSYVWAAGSSTGMPEFYDPAGNRHIRADDIVAAYGENRDAASIRAARAFFETVEQLLNIAVASKQGEVVDQKDLNAIRHRVIVNHSLVKNLSGYYQQLLSHGKFWSVDGLSEIGGAVKTAPYGETSES